MGTAEAYAHRTAEPLLKQLAEYQTQGQIVDFGFLPDRHAIRVTMSDAGGLQALGQLNDLERILPLDEAGMACATESARATEDALEAVQAARVAPSGAEDTNPFIRVYYSDDYGRVSGHTDPSVDVEMVLRDASGSVEVTAAGNTVSTVVARRTAFPDPTTDTVTGTMAPNRTVEISADSTEADCEYDFTGAITTSDSQGDFSVTLTPGFDRSVDVTVAVYDANGNYSYTPWTAARPTAFSSLTIELTFPLPLAMSTSKIAGRGAACCAPTGNFR